MDFIFTEYLLKGIYLGLLFFVALKEPNLQATGTVAACTFGGLALALGISARAKIREGYRVQGRLPAFLLFLLLESPGLVYVGVVLGTFAGALAALPRDPGQANWPLAAAIAAGALLGVVFAGLRTVRKRRLRLVLAMFLGAAIVGLAVYLFGRGDEPPWRDQTTFGLQLLLGIPVFYLLTFAGKAEESEVEVAVVCAALGLGAAMLVPENPPNYRAGIFILSLTLYFYYSTRVLSGLKVFKHAARGFSYAKVGRYRHALLSFRRALYLDKTNKLAREGLWSVHRAMDLSQVVDDPEMLKLVDLDLCLERATSLLLAGRPGPEKLSEAHHLLDLILNQRPAARPVVDYWRSVAFTHAREYDRAAEALTGVLDSSGFAPGDPHRLSVLLPAWQLALILHPEINRRVGSAQLAIPGRRMEAIAAVERQLAEQADDTTAWEMKRLLYSGLTEAEYLTRHRQKFHNAAANGAAGFDFGTLEHFDYSYAHQLGLALIHDGSRWERGAEYLRIAARGLPAQGPSIFQQIAQAEQQAGRADDAWRTYELAKQAGKRVGPKNLSNEERQIYFTIIKQLGEQARSRNDLDAAIENYHLYTENERSGVETLRTLADLYERKGEALGALRATEKALLYNAKDADLLERKERYYYSVMPDDLRARPESARSGLDVDYCLRKARSLLDLKEGDSEHLDWAQHLAELALVIKPDSVSAKVLNARALRRRGEIDSSLAALEDVYHHKPEKFASSADEEAWFLACRLLGEMYLYELAKPDLAVPCFNDFRKSAKSGADTLYKLGQAYEQLGDRARAMKCYEHVTAYEGHPLAYDARSALYRLQS